MAESTEYEPSRRHWWGERTTNAFSAGSKFIYSDWLLWPDLATTPPIACLPTIVYTLLIGSLFLRERDEACTTDSAMPETLALHLWNTLCNYVIDCCYVSNIECFYPPLINSQIIWFIMKIILQWWLSVAHQKSNFIMIGNMPSNGKNRIGICSNLILIFSIYKNKKKSFKTNIIHNLFSI